jgi:hypothetical protein
MLEGDKSGHLPRGTHRLILWLELGKEIDDESSVLGHAGKSGEAK